MFMILVATIAMIQATPPQRIERFLGEPAAVITVGGERPWRLEISAGMPPRGETRATAVTYVAELFEGTGPEARSVGEVDTRTCLPLVGVVSDISGLFSPRIDIGQAYGLPPEGSGVHPPGLPRVSALDAENVTVEANAVQPGDRPARLSITTNTGPIAEFVYASRVTVDPCFTAQAREEGR